MSKRLTTSAAIMAALLMFTACGEAAVSNISSSSISEVTTEASSETSASASEHKAYDHTFNPHCLTKIYINKYGEQFEKEYYQFCDDILAGSDTVKCSNPSWINLFRDISRTYLPIVHQYCYYNGDDYPSAGDGVYKIEYSIPKDEYLKKVDEFKSRVEYLIESCLYEDDTELEKAIALYHSESSRIKYDYYVMENTVIVTDDGYQISPYRSIMTDQGICQEIAGCYAYLLMQVGIDAITCGALNKECTLAHEWTIVSLGGTYYHCDVTFQLENPNTLQYFGLNDAERELEGDWDMPYNNIGDLNEIWGSDLPITDTRFAEVWKCYYYELDRDKDMLYCFSKGDGDIPYFEMTLK